MNLFLLGATPSIETYHGETPKAKLAKTGGNLGNQLIAHSLLRQVTYSSVQWDYNVRPEEVEETCDRFLIAAANFLHPSFDFSGMADFIAKTDLPVSIVGL